MSFLNRLANRAAPHRAAAAALRPKGVAKPGFVRRMEEEEEAQPLRRAESAAPQPTRRAAGEAAAVRPLRRMEEEEAAQPVRRMEEEEEAQPLRRMEEEEEALQTVRRAGPAPEALSPDNSPTPETAEGDPEPPAAMALRREIGAGVEMAGDVAPPSVFAPDFSEPVDAAAPFAPAQQAFERPQVQIDQIDVLIHEPVAPATASGAGGPMANRSRAIRARHLKRL